MSADPADSTGDARQAAILAEAIYHHVRSVHLATRAEQELSDAVESDCAEDFDRVEETESEAKWEKGEARRLAVQVGRAEAMGENCPVDELLQAVADLVESAERGSSGMTDPSVDDVRPLLDRAQDFCQRVSSLRY